MSDLDTIKSAVYSDVVAVVNGYTPSPHDHVIREDDDEPEQPPAVSLNGSVTNRDEKNGLHVLRVLEVQHNPFDVRYGRDKTFNVDVTIADTDGGRADNIYEDILNQFTYDNRVRNPQDFVGGEYPPIDDVYGEGTNPLTRDQRVGHNLAVGVDYTRTFFHSDLTDPPSEVTRVEQTFEEGDLIYVTSADGTSIEPA